MIEAFSSGTSCDAMDSGPVIPVSPLVKFLERVQETAFHSFGQKGFDPKVYVDLSLKNNLSITVEAFDKLSRTESGLVSNEDLSRFIEEYFGDAGEDLECVEPSDFAPEPEGFLPAVKNREMRAWALEVHSLWNRLSKKVSSHVFGCPDYHTLLPLKNAVVVPGSRFREVYYWDAYWVIRGLLVSKMFDTAKGIIHNFISLIDEYGYVLNGARAYYTNRSQPPLLSSMVIDVYAQTGDKDLVINLFLHCSKSTSFGIQVLMKSFIFSLCTIVSCLVSFRSHLHFLLFEGIHKVTIRDAEGSEHALSRYYAMWNEPRPESAIFDKKTASTLSNNCEKTKLYRELASTAESGWDFSTRWMRDASDMTTLTTTSIIPVDLNAFLLKMELDITSLSHITGDARTVSLFRKAAEARKKAINSILWNSEMNQWLDYWLNDSTESQDVYTWKASNQNKKVFASNFITLWIHLSVPDVSSMDESARTLQSSGLVFPAGIATSLTNSGQQWDFPNGWAPLQHMIIEGLARSGSQKVRDFAEELAVKWIRTNYVAFNKTGAMHEKYDVQRCGEVGEGGEYAPQTGFGWSNGVVLALLEEFGWPEDLKLDLQ